MGKEWDLLFRPPRWVTIRLVVITKESEGEYSEEETLIVHCRCDAELVYLYYPSSDPDQLVVFLADGDCMRIAATMEEAAELFEPPEEVPPLVLHPGAPE